LVYVVLVLAHADALRVNLDKFGKRVHQAPTNGNGSAYCDVFGRKFVAGNLGGRVDGGSIFGNGKYLRNDSCGRLNCTRGLG